MLYPVTEITFSGGDNDLSVAVLKYEPKQVQCSGTVSPSLLSSCQNIVNTMPASMDFTTWGPENDPLAVMKLPLTYHSCEFVYQVLFPKNDASETQVERMMHLVDQRCKLSIRTAGPTDTFSRYQFWTVAVALTGVCVRNEQVGMRDGLGKSYV